MPESLSRTAIETNPLFDILFVPSNEQVMSKNPVLDLAQCARTTGIAYAPVTKATHSRKKRKIVFNIPRDEIQIHDACVRELKSKLNEWGFIVYYIMQYDSCYKLMRWRAGNHLDVAELPRDKKSLEVVCAQLGDWVLLSIEEIEFLDMAIKGRLDLWPKIDEPIQFLGKTYSLSELGNLEAIISGHKDGISIWALIFHLCLSLPISKARVVLNKWLRYEAIIMSSTKKFIAAIVSDFNLSELGLTNQEYCYIQLLKKMVRSQTQSGYIEKQGYRSLRFRPLQENKSKPIIVSDSVLPERDSYEKYIKLGKRDASACIALIVEDTKNKHLEIRVSIYCDMYKHFSKANIMPVLDWLLNEMLGTMDGRISLFQMLCDYHGLMSIASDEHSVKVIKATLENSDKKIKTFHSYGLGSPEDYEVEEEIIEPRHELASKADVVLCKVIGRGFKDTVSLLLDEVTVNAKDCIYKAIEKCDFDILKKLTAMAKVDSSTWEYGSKDYLAIAKISLDVSSEDVKKMMDLLVESGLDINKKHDGGVRQFNCLLGCYLKTHSIDYLKYSDEKKDRFLKRLQLFIVRYKANVVTKIEGFTSSLAFFALAALCYANDAKTMEFFLSIGFDINESDARAKNMTLIAHKIKEGNIDVVRRCRDNSANLDLEVLYAGKYKMKLVNLSAYCTSSIRAYYMVQWLYKNVKYLFNDKQATHTLSAMFLQRGDFRNAMVVLNLHSLLPVFNFHVKPGISHSTINFLFLSQGGIPARDLEKWQVLCAAPYKPFVCSLSARRETSFADMEGSVQSGLFYAVTGFRNLGEGHLAAIKSPIGRAMNNVGEFVSNVQVAIAVGTKGLADERSQSEACVHAMDNTEIPAVSLRSLRNCEVEECKIDSHDTVNIEFVQGLLKNEVTRLYCVDMKDRFVGVIGIIPSGVTLKKTHWGYIVKSAQACKLRFVMCVQKSAFLKGRHYITQQEISAFEQRYPGVYNFKSHMSACLFGSETKTFFDNIKLKIAEGVLSCENVLYSFDGDNVCYITFKMDEGYFTFTADYSQLFAKVVYETGALVGYSYGRTRSGSGSGSGSAGSTFRVKRERETNSDSVPKFSFDYWAETKAFAQRYFNICKPVRWAALLNKIQMRAREHILVDFNDVDALEAEIMAFLASKDIPFYRLCVEDVINSTGEELICDRVPLSNETVNTFVTGSDYARFIASARLSENAVLLINWNDFAICYRTQINSWLESVDGFKIVGMLPSQTNDASIYTRHKHYVHLDALGVVKKPKPLSATIASARIDLKGGLNMAAELFGRVEQRAGVGVTYSNIGKLAALLGSTHAQDIIFQNMPKELKRYFHRMLAMAAARGHFKNMGVLYRFHNNTHFRMDAAEFEFSSFAKMDVYYCRAYEKIDEHIPLVNSVVFNHLFSKIKSTDSSLYAEEKGVLLADTGSSLELYIASDLTQTQWYMLYAVAKERSLSFMLYLTDGVLCPGPVNVKLEIDGEAEEKESTVSPLRFIICDQAEAFLKTLPKNDRRLVVDVDDLEYGDVVCQYRHNKQYFYAESKKRIMLKTEVVKSALLPLLIDSDLEIVLVGRFSDDLLACLAPMLHAMKMDVNGVYFDIKAKLVIAYENWKGKENVAHFLSGSVVQELKNTVMPASVSTSHRVIEEVDCSDSSITTKADFSRFRSRLFLPALASTGVISLVGEPGQGQYELLASLQNDCVDVKIYSGEEQIKNFAQDYADDKIKLLVIDTRYEQAHYTQYAPRFRSPDGACDMFLPAKHGRDSEVITLSAQHKLVFICDEKHGLPTVFSRFNAFVEFKLKEIPQSIVSCVIAPFAAELGTEAACSLVAEYKKQRVKDKSITVKTLEQRALTLRAKQRVMLASHDIDFIENSEGMGSAGACATTAVDVDMRTQPEISFTPQQRDLKARVETFLLLHTEKASIRPKVGLHFYNICGPSAMGKSFVLEKTFEQRGWHEGREFVQLHKKLSVADRFKKLKMAYELGQIVWFDEVNAYLSVRDELTGDTLDTMLVKMLSGRYQTSTDFGTASKARPGFAVLSSCNDVSEGGREVFSKALQACTLVDRINAPSAVDIAVFIAKEYTYDVGMLRAFNLSCDPGVLLRMHAKICIASNAIGSVGVIRQFGDYLSKLNDYLLSAFLDALDSLCLDLEPYMEGRGGSDPRLHRDAADVHRRRGTAAVLAQVQQTLNTIGRILEVSKVQRRYCLEHIDRLNSLRDVLVGVLNSCTSDPAVVGAGSAGAHALPDFHSAT